MINVANVKISSSSSNSQLEIGNIGIGNISTMATLNNNSTIPHFNNHKT